MVEYNKLEDETTNLIDSEISSFVDRHFKGMSDLLEKQETPVSDRVRFLFELDKVSDALKYLLKCESERKLNISGSSISSEERESMKELYNIVRLLSKKECKCLNDILNQYGEKIKEQSPDSVSVFERIKLIFKEIIARFRGKSLEDFDDEHTTKIGGSKFYYDAVTQAGSKQGANESEWEIVHYENVPEQKANKSSTLETIVEKDEGQSVESDYVKDTQEHTYENIDFSTTAQFVQEETLSKPQVARIGKKPVIPQKSQKVIDAGNKIREGRSQKAETPIYTSHAIMNLRSPCEKPKIAPKPIIGANLETKQYGQNVASRKLFFESLNNSANQKPKGNVKGLVEKFEARCQGATTSRGCC